LKNYALTARLHDAPAVIEAYERHHADVWPEVIEDMRRGGALSTRIYRHGRELFMFMETDDDFDLAAYGANLSNPRTQAWQALMDSYMEPAPAGAPGLRWTEMREICVILTEG